MRRNDPRDRARGYRGHDLPYPLAEAEAIRKAYALQPDLGRQRAELLARFAALTERRSFDPGHLVAEKPGLRAGGTKGRALIFLRALDTDRWQDRALVEAVIRDGGAAHGLPDCLVGCCEGETLVEVPCARERLRPLDPEEVAEIEREDGGFDDVG